MTEEYIQYGSAKIKFFIIFAQRKTLGITVTPEQKVIVKAPIESSLDKVYNKLEKRAPWILRQLDFFNSFQPLTPPRKYFTGETHLYLGRQYRLKIIKKRKQDVKLKNGHFYVYTSDKDNKAKVKQQLDEWYRIHAVYKFTQYLTELLKDFEEYHFKVSDFRLKKMTKRWGSCNKNGHIILNTELIKAPKGCIDYVLIHELCHLKYANHSKSFYSLQKKLMPNWLAWKDRLEKFMA